MLYCAAVAFLPPLMLAAAGTAQTTLEPAAASRFAGLALKCLHQEYPNHMSLSLNSAADARPPHELTPAFYGCLDWHSDVHGHWLLARLLNLYPQAPFAAQARSELARSFTADNIAGELRYLAAPARSSFERPYGLAWLLRHLLAGAASFTADPDSCSAGQRRSSPWRRRPPHIL